jgi:hypothetical protein
VLKKKQRHRLKWKRRLFPFVANSEVWSEADTNGGTNCPPAEGRVLGVHRTHSEVGGASRSFVSLLASKNRRDIFYCNKSKITLCLSAQQSPLSTKSHFYILDLTDTNSGVLGLKHPTIREGGDFVWYEYFSGDKGISELNPLLRGINMNFSLFLKKNTTFVPK